MSDEPEENGFTTESTEEKTARKREDGSQNKGKSGLLAQASASAALREGLQRGG